MDKKGWMKGVGDGNFYPDEKINYIETLTVMIRAAGKEEEAEDFGGYPLGYEYTADRYGITENISGGLDSPIYRGAIAQLLLNSIEKIDEGESGSGTLEPEDKLGVVKDREFLESSYIKVKKDTDLASAIELLPREVYVTLTSKKAVLLKVNWDYGSGYNKDVSGTYNIKGTVEIPSGISDPNKKLQNLYGNIEVVDGETDTTGEKIVNSYAELGTKDFQAEFGDSETEALKKLTSKTKIYLIGGGSIDADIKWSISGYNGLESEKYDALGKIELPKGVVDRLGVIKDLNATLTVGEEPDKLEIKLVDMISDTEYKITLNKLMENLLPNTVTLEEIEVKAKGDIPSVEKISYGSSKKEIIVKLDKPLDQSKAYAFKVWDGEGNMAPGPIPEAKPNSNIIDKIIVGDNIVPADEDAQIKFKALNADGIDITESVRDKVDIVSTIGTDLNGSSNFKLKHNQVEFFYLEYKDKEYNEETNKVMKKTPTYRIVGENRRIVSIENWTFVKEGEPIDWSKKVQTMQIGGGSRNIYINSEDQFGDIGKVKYSAKDIIKLDDPKALRSDIASVTSSSMTDGNYYSVGPIAKIDLANPTKLGTTSLNIEIEKDGSKFKTAIPINVVADSALSSLHLEKSTITLSSSASLTSADKTETVLVKLRDQYGKDIDIAHDKKVSHKIVSGGELIEVKAVTNTNDQFEIKSLDGKSGTAKVEFTYDGKTVTQTVAVKSPGPVSYMDYSGFEKELIVGGSPEKMEIKIYQYDKDGVAVKRLVENITAEITNKGIVLTGVATESNGIVTVDSANLTANTVNTLEIKVGGITVMEEKFVVKN